MKLGQHFLKSKTIAEEIANAAELSSSDLVLEAGPGKGILTKALLKRAGKVIAVEKDPRLATGLAKSITTPKLKVVAADILKIPISKLIPSKSAFKIVANIPYYITSRFLRRFLEAKNQPRLMVLMVQKEVGQRILATAPKTNLLALSVQVYGRPEILRYVSKNLFSPPPKVDSSVIKIDKISKDFFKENKIKEDDFFKIVKKGFSHKRKFLKNNLGLSGELLKNCGIPSAARAQELNLSHWACLVRSFRFLQTSKEKNKTRLKTIKRRSIVQ
jgi:16S rRNA (adenine1518-N6/adenine1519-N6)-dimethyltransferase